MSNKLPKTVGIFSLAILYQNPLQNENVDKIYQFFVIMTIILVITRDLTWAQSAKISKIVFWFVADIHIFLLVLEFLKNLFSTPRTMHFCQFLWFRYRNCLIWSDICSESPKNWCFSQIAEKIWDLYIFLYFS